MLKVDHFFNKFILCLRFNIFGAQTSEFFPRNKQINKTMLPKVQNDKDEVRY